VLDSQKPQLFRHFLRVQSGTHFAKTGGAMSTNAHLGTSVYIKGQVISKEPLTIAGRVEGTVQAEGHALTILAGAQVTASSILAHEVILGGQVNGQVNATGRIIVRETARIEGDLTAPSISVAEGAVLKGRIQTSDRKRAPLQLAS
jgi:cytoskeletal protein CcmA (bactofilin family)